VLSVTPVFLMLWVSLFFLLGAASVTPVVPVLSSSSCIVNDRIDVVGLFSLFGGAVLVFLLLYVIDCCGSMCLFSS
jgi:hypothetical protein